jgi:hypothetical protein
MFVLHRTTNDYEKVKHATNAAHKCCNPATENINEIISDGE